MKLATDLNLDLIPHHMKSHQYDQYDEREYDQVSWQAKLNCDCDQQAVSVRECHTCAFNSQVPYKLPPGHAATLQIGNTFIIKHLPLAVRNAVYKGDMKRYVIKSAGWENHTFFAKVDWEAYR